MIYTKMLKTLGNMLMYRYNVGILAHRRYDMHQLEKALPAKRAPRAKVVR